MIKNDKKGQITKKEDSFLGAAGKFRKNPAIYIGSVAVLVLIIIAFVGGDILSVLGGRSGGDVVFGYYDKIPIVHVPGNTLANYYEWIARYYQSLGSDINNFQAQIDIWREAYAYAVEDTAVLQIMKKSNYSVPEKVVDRRVAQLSQFQENGRFSTVLYNRLSNSERLALWRQVQDELTKSTFYNDFTNGLLVPSREADFVGRMTQIRRTFEMVSFDIESFPDSEYLGFARENPDLFNSIHLSKISITSSERDARRVLESIKSGAVTFEDAARAQSKDGYADRGGDMGIHYNFELEYDIPNLADRNNIFNLRRGEMSDVMYINDIWVFFRAEDASKPANLEDEAVMQKIKSYFRSYNRGRMEDWAIAQARSFISDAETFGLDNAVNRWGIRKAGFGPLPLNYGNVDIFTSYYSYYGGVDIYNFNESFAVLGLSQVDIRDLSNNENFWRTAFSTRINTPCEPIVQRSKVIVFFPVEETKDEDAALITASAYSYWVSLKVQNSFFSYFFYNPRMDDRFYNIYPRLLSQWQ
ncbi:MAG: SurA N-terminal domain-containing protein [Treponema sp.]|jgi:hypothetical protein|nr:SurA N-terminal domain-containing protein [Treponema sp.]